jgi:hypothetical protein
LSGLKADGLIGLAPSEGGSQADMLIDEFKESGFIEDRVFSFQIGRYETDSKFTLGGYNVDKYADGEIFWHNITHPSYWGLNISNAYLGDLNMNQNASRVVIDTGSSFMLMPTEDFASFANYFSSRYNCSSLDEGFPFHCDCSVEDIKTFPEIKVQIDDTIYKLTYENYVYLWEG